MDQKDSLFRELSLTADNNIRPEKNEPSLNKLLTQFCYVFFTLKYGSLCSDDSHLGDGTTGCPRQMPPPSNLTLEDIYLSKSSDCKFQIKMLNFVIF